MRRTISMVAVLVMSTAGLVVASAAPALASVPGVEIVVSNSGWSSSTVKSAVVTCPAGKQVIGTGWSIGSVTSGVHVPEVRPTATTVEVVAYEDADGVATDWSVSARAVCADPLPGWEIVTTTSTMTTAAIDRVQVAACPSGKKLLGAAGEVSGGGGRVLLDGIVPTSGLVAVTAHTDGWGSDNIWNLRAHAICADPVAGHQVVSSSSGTTSADKTEFAYCPAGTTVLSSGGVIVPNDGRVALSSLLSTAYGGSEYARVAGQEDDPGWATYWRIDAFAICATT